MRALRVSDRGTALTEIDRPAPAGEALIRVTLSGICNTDLEIARGYAGFRGTIGHEFVGVIEEPGEGPLPRGTRVVGEINAGCGTCDDCRRGDSRHCPTRTVLGIVNRDGAHADYVRLPARNLLAVPDSISDAHAVFAEPLAAAAGMVERCAALAETTTRVAIIGDGKLGLLCAMALRSRGLAPILIGKHAAKLAIARARDVETALLDDASRFGRVFDVVVEASGHPSGFSLAMDLLRPRGTLVLKSTFAGTTPLDSARIVVEELSVVGSRCGRFAPALDLLAHGTVDVSPLITETFPLAKAEDAMRAAAAAGVLKVLLRPDAS
ncbi:MAG TPA: alcohol dehydrogenase catalytic domain-containing protein [Kofleriaceae bacterium]|nr:alcohol dehydrogenase catalytic domain-containing protein [Kofleriaceae bacterium]